MKEFFKYVFASALGFIVGGILLIMFTVAILSAVVGTLGKDTETSVEDGTVLVVRLSGDMKERSTDNPLQRLNLTGLKDASMGLDDVLQNIDKATRDERIRGILLDLRSTPSGRATNEEIRNALIAFRKSGKFIYAFGDYYSQTGYYLATTADRIYCHPQGTIDFKGLKMEMMFLKGALAKLEVEPQIFRHGKYKSAIEPLILDKMSPENREQLETLMNSMWNHMLENIAASRKIPVDSLRQYANDYIAKDPEAALKARLIDRVSYYDELLTDLKAACAWKSIDKPKLVELKKYDHAIVKSDKPYSSNKVALIYAVGEINDGEGDDESIGSITTAAEIRKARMDTSIKAIVLRVNSPGGSALASDVIWREVVLAKKTKPVIASMGDYAASGGYYISCAADSIVAEPTTLTGSIGVFGMMINAQKLFNNKLGITFDTLKTSRFSDIGSMTRPVRAEERLIIEHEIEKIYDVFIGHVAAGRNTTKAAVDSIGQGRVWSGTDALEIGLVDKLGNIDDAVAIAARMAKLENYRVVKLPRQKEFLEKLMEDLSTEAETYFTKRQLGENYKYYIGINRLLRQQGIRAELPFTPDIY